MIEHLRGRIAELSPAQAVVECCGVGYGVNISLNTYTALQGKAECKLFVSEMIREDAHVLYGFATREERELFLLLVTVPGIGGNTARMILSSLSPDELVVVITAGNEAALKAVKGIGLKTAQRIIVDLKDKVGAIGALPASHLSQANAAGEAAEEAVTALTMLGFAAQPSRKAVSSIVAESPGLPVEAIIKQALKRL